MFRTYAAAMDYLNRATDYERQEARYSKSTYNLDRMRRLSAAMGHVERTFRSLHIAGTKGKGSVAHMAEAILRRAGHRTGLYTSPHLVDLRERIRIDGTEVSERDLLWAMNRMGRALVRLRPTYFEIMTEAAFLIFSRKRVDFAVIEVGLGGRLDATNVIVPAACAITLVDYDHMDKLGHTIRAIAREKAGIIKPGVPVVTGVQRPAALREIRRAARPEVPAVWRPVQVGTVLKFKVEGVRGNVYRCELPVLGPHQAGNAAIAIGLVEASGAEVTPFEVREALRRVRLPGRVEVVRRRHWIIVESAQNTVSARALREAVQDL
jgi:dihydrofolate synthase/folylpolyglutamate synthase